MWGPVGLCPMGRGGACPLVALNVVAGDAGGEAAGRAGHLVARAAVLLGDRGALLGSGVDRDVARAAAVAAALKPEQFRVTVPTQIIWGTGDPALRPVLLDGIETLVPDLRLHHVDGAGHWVARERADEVNAVLRGFVAEHHQQLTGATV